MSNNIYQAPAYPPQTQPTSYQPQPQLGIFNAPYRPVIGGAFAPQPAFGYGWSVQQIPEIKNWSFSYGLENKRNLSSLSCYISGTIIGGQAQGHIDGQKIVTSKLKSLDFDKSIAETNNDTLYRLGNMDKTSDKFYNDGLQFLMNKKILKG